MANHSKRLAPKPSYTSPKQLTLAGFETPFEQQLDESNRWVQLANQIPWDELCNEYLRHVGTGDTGRKPINPRIIIGAVIIKHICNLDDEETVQQISENLYMQYFLGYPSFTTTPPFDPSLFVTIRKRTGMDTVNALNERIIALKTKMGELPSEEKNDESQTDKKDHNGNSTNLSQEPVANKGRVLMDASACPQDIAYPTDLDLLSSAREKSEQLIDILYPESGLEQKPRTYRENARKDYLHTAQNRNKSRKTIRKAVRKQLGYLSRNLKSIHRLLDCYPSIPLSKSEYKYLLVITTVFEQQQEMFEQQKHSIEHRIVSIHQPHVRPIVRGKSKAKVEFGSKIHISLVDGITFLDELSWDAFNEGNHLTKYVELYRQRFGCYPRELLVDQIYCTRANRAALKLLNIKLIAKPLGRPSAVKEHIRPGERNPVEGKFGQAKTAYGLDRIGARLKNTSESWIASIILVLNLVKLAGLALYCRITNTVLVWIDKQAIGLAFIIRKKIGIESAVLFSV
jgi:hypothetical protein